MPARKTFKVEDLRQKVNAYLALDTINEDQKNGCVAVLESILHETGNYNGFQYIHGWQGTETYQRYYYPPNYASR